MLILDSIFYLIELRFIKVKIVSPLIECKIFSVEWRSEL